jgi:hypothetical protein
MERNLAQMKAQHPALVERTLLEAGKAIGKSEGAINVLEQLVLILAQPDPVEEAPATLKVAEDTTPA